MQKKIVFFGSGYYVIPLVEKIKDQGLIFVVTSEPEGELVNYLKSSGIPYLYSRLKNIGDIEKLKSLEPDLGILASFGAILPKEIIEIFPLGILNIHPSLLPKYRGSSPIQFTILDDEKVSGVSIIKLDEYVDHGPIIAQKEVNLEGNETLKSLTELLFLEGTNLISEVVQKINKGLPLREKQQRINNEKVTRKIKKTDGGISLSNPPEVKELKRKIRAFYPWPGVYLTVTLGGKNRQIKLMPNDTVQVEGKKPMSHKDFINGYGKDAEDVLLKLHLL